MSKIYKFKSHAEFRMTLQEVNQHLKHIVDKLEDLKGTALTTPENAQQVSNAIDYVHQARDELHDAWGPLVKRVD